MLYRLKYTKTIFTFKNPSTTKTEFLIQNFGAPSTQIMPSTQYMFYVITLSKRKLVVAHTCFIFFLCKWNAVSCFTLLISMQPGLNLHTFYFNSFCSFLYLNRHGVLACFEAKTTFLMQEFYQKLWGNLNMFSVFKTFSLLTYIFPTVWTQSHGWFIVMARALGRDCYTELFQSYFAEVSDWNRAVVWLCFSLLIPTPLSKKTKEKKKGTQKC